MPGPPQQRPNFSPAPHMTGGPMPGQPPRFPGGQYPHNPHGKMFYICEVWV